MESSYAVSAPEPEASAPEQVDVESAPVPALILLEPADDAGVCDVDGVCR